MSALRQHLLKRSIFATANTYWNRDEMRNIFKRFMIKWHLITYQIYLTEISWYTLRIFSRIFSTIRVWNSLPDSRIVTPSFVLHFVIILSICDVFG